MPPPLGRLPAAPLPSMPGLPHTECAEHRVPLAVTQVLFFHICLWICPLPHQTGSPWGAAWV